jgi:hypothetical protein
MALRNDLYVIARLTRDDELVLDNGQVRAHRVLPQHKVEDSLFSDAAHVLVAHFDVQTPRVQLVAVPNNFAQAILFVALQERCDSANAVRNEALSHPDAQAQRSLDVLPD